MRKLLFLFILAFSLFLFTKNAQAKVLPQAASLGKGVATIKIAGSGINVYPRLRGDRRALIVNFSNLQNAKAVSYAFTYTTSSQDEGAMGALKLDGQSNSSQELLFGTCSKNICRYHVGVNNAKLEVSYTSKTGKKYIKRYKIKV